MTATPDIARRYFDAWTAGKMDEALALLDPEIVFHTPNGTLHGAEAVRGFMGPFAGMLQEARLISLMTDGNEALLVYDTRTPAVESAPAAEHYVVRDGRIVEARIIFDRLPFALARGEVAPAK